MRRLISLIAIGALCLTPVAASAFWTPTPNKPPVAGMPEVTLTLDGPTSVFAGTISKVTFWSQIGKRGYPIRDCLELESQGCELSQIESISSGQISATATVLLPFCDEKFLNSCIESVSLVNTDAKRINLDFYRYSYPTLELNGASKFGLPGGKSTPVFSTPSMDLTSKREFAVRAELQLSYEAAVGRFVAKDLKVVVVPLSFSRASRFCYPTWREDVAGLFGDINSPSAKVITECKTDGAVFHSGFEKASPENFEPDTRVGLSLRLPKKLGGWFFGQFSQVEAEIREINAAQMLLEIDADVVAVPQLQVVVPKDLIDQGLKFDDTEITYLDGRGANYLFPAATKDAVDAVKKLRQASNDTSTAENTVWNFSSAGSWVGSRCSSTVVGISGIVATNAMAYDGYKPSFVSGALNFDVAGMHYNSDGSIAVGSYDLLMRSEFARCLYGFTTAPISGTVSVINESGTPVVATTTVSERDGFIKLTARGFGFSEKTIKAKLTQKAVTITCQRLVNKKVKETRVVKGKVCPKGFTKKK